MKSLDAIQANLEQINKTLESIDETLGRLCAVLETAQSIINIPTRLLSRFL